MKDYYQILQVHPNVDLDVLNNAYRTLVKKYHPDRYYSTAQKKIMEAQLQEINEAYTILSQEDSRKAYDTTYPDLLKQLQAKQVQDSKTKKASPKLIYWILLGAFVMILGEAFLKVLLFTPLGKLALLVLIGLLLYKRFKK